MLDANFSLKDMVTELVNKDNQIEALGAALIDQEEKFNKERNSWWWSGFWVCGILVGCVALFKWLCRKDFQKQDNFDGLNED